ncbi:MAG: hypothetical protein IJW94_06015 [Oscillospiraceae bacterium]|nr:hypothetical protein [Oscillospiraceae bacterium]
MNLFNNKNSSGVEISQKQLLQNKYTNAANNILWVVVLTVINIVLLVTNSNTYFLFSAFIPFFLVDIGMYLCGMYPSEVYGEDFAAMEFLPQSFFTITLCFAAVILILYVISWVFSKKQKCGWMILALVFFSVDTLVMFVLNGIVIESIIDYAIHAWVIVSLINGLVSYSKLKKLPKEPEEDLTKEPIFATVDTTDIESVTSDTPEETI